MQLLLCLTKLSGTQWKSPLFFLRCWQAKSFQLHSQTPNLWVGGHCFRFLSFLFFFFCWLCPYGVLCDLITLPPDSIQLWFKHSCWTGAASRDPKATVIYCVSDIYRDWQLQWRRQVSAWSLLLHTKASVFCLYMQYISRSPQTSLLSA